MHYTYTLTGKGITVVEHAPEARPRGDSTKSFTLYEERGRWVAECNFCEHTASTGKTRRSAASRMWGSRDHRYCYRKLADIEIDEAFHYTYTQARNGLSVEKHKPQDRPEYDGEESYTVYKEGAEWLADCNRCGNWAAVCRIHAGTVARMFATHTSEWCDEHLYGLWRDHQKARLASFG